MRHAFFIFLVACGGSNQPATQPTTTNTAPAVPVHETVTTGTCRPRSPRLSRAGSQRGRQGDGRGASSREMLAFFGVAPGMKVAEIAAGPRLHHGVVARAVGDTGKVWAEQQVHRRSLAEKLGAKGSRRPSKERRARGSEFDNPFPPEAKKDLDAVSWRY